MRNITRFVAALTVAASLFAVAPSVPAGASTGSPPAERSTVTRTLGTVEMRRGNTTDWRVCRPSGAYRTVTLYVTAANGQFRFISRKNSRHEQTINRTGVSNGATWATGGPCFWVGVRLEYRLTPLGRPLPAGINVQFNT